MVPAPMAVGLTVCHYVAFEEGTRNVTIAGSFLGFRGTNFPFTPSPFCVFAPLIGGQGRGVIELSVTRLQTDTEVFTLQRPIHFPDRFTEVRALFRLANFVFPAPGVYLFTLLVDGEWVAQRRIMVTQMEESA